MTMGFRLFLITLWTVVAGVTLWALIDQGLTAAVATFFGDFSHPWRAQFYTDLEAHLLLAACWILWREGASARAFLFAAATMLLGALFTLPYILFAGIAAKGDARLLLLGRNG